jgi:hypothetical protein
MKMKWKSINSEYLNDYTQTTRITMGALLAALAAIFQSAGVFSGIGYAISILTTFPIVLATMISIRIGVLSYVVTILLLMMLQPSELLVFPFTTGLLGLSLGLAIRFVKKWGAVILLGAAGLTFGILFLLYVIRFPVLGPNVSSTFNLNVVLGTLSFSILYSAIWYRISVLGMRAIDRVLIRRISIEKEG